MFSNLISIDLCHMSDLNEMTRKLQMQLDMYVYMYLNANVKCHVFLKMETETWQNEKTEYISLTHLLLSNTSIKHSPMNTFLLSI